jgi:tetratricopeptide (TPR) repeat protein
MDLCEFRLAADLLKQSDDGSPMSHAMRADMLAELGDRQGAESELDLLAMLGADQEFIRRSRLGNLIGLNDFEAAEKMLAELPEESGAYRDSVRVAIAQRRGDHAAVATMLSDMLKDNPDDAQLNNDYAWEQACTNSQLQRALAAAQKAVLLENCLPSYHNTLGFVLLKLNRIDEARREFMLALKSQKAESRTINHFCLGECDRLQGNLSSAAQYYRLARDGKGSPEFSQLAVMALSSIGETGQGNE